MEQTKWIVKRVKSIFFPSSPSPFFFLVPRESYFGGCSTMCASLHTLLEIVIPYLIWSFGFYEYLFPFAFPSPLPYFSLTK